MHQDAIITTIHHYYLSHHNSSFEYEALVISGPSTNNFSLIMQKLQIVTRKFMQKLLFMQKLQTVIMQKLD